MIDCTTFVMDHQKGILGRPNRWADKHTNKSYLCSIQHCTPRSPILLPAGYIKHLPDKKVRILSLHNLTNDKVLILLVLSKMGNLKTPKILDEIKRSDEREIESIL